jgi:hypothetical protein
MLRYRVSGISEGLAQTVRSTLHSPHYGHPAHVEMATVYGPCRQCLKTFNQGQQERILFTSQPFISPGALPAPGPVFIHREACRQYDELRFPEGLRAIPLVMESYGERGRLLNQQRVGERTVEEVIEEQLAEPRIEYLHVRNAEAGCFIARVQPVFACD